MAECTNIDLRNARDARHLSRWQVAEAMHISEDTLNRWEAGKVQPEPDDVDRLGEIYQDPLLWHRWMRSHYESYRSRYPEAAEMPMFQAVVNTRYQLGDVMALQDAIERDAISGTIDNRKMCDEYIKQAKEAQVALGEAIRQLRGDSND